MIKTCMHEGQDKLIGKEEYEKFITDFMCMTTYEPTMMGEPWGSEYPDMEIETFGTYIKVSDMKRLIEMYFKTKTGE